MNPRLILGRYPRRDDRCLHPDYPQWRSGFPGFPEALSPAVLAMTPKGAYFANIAAIIAAMAVSFVVSAVLLKTSKVKEEDDIEAATRRMHDMKAESKGASPLAAGNVTNDLSHVRKIIVACDAGMGSSAMGAGVLRKKVQDAGLSNISVTNSAINNLPPDVDLGHHPPRPYRARHAPVPQAQHISLTNFLDSGLYTSLTERLGRGPAPHRQRSQSHR